MHGIEPECLGSYYVNLYITVQKMGPTQAKILMWAGNIEENFFYALSNTFACVNFTANNLFPHYSACDIAEGQVTVVEGSNEVGGCVDWINNTSYLMFNSVKGTDENCYVCIAPHTSSSDNKPITGANWANYWAIEQTGNCD